MKYHFISDQGVENLTQDRGRRAGVGGRRLPHPRPVRGDRARGAPQLDAQGADHAVRGRQDLPVQPVRLDQGVAALGLPAHRGRPDDAGPQPHRPPLRRSSSSPSSRATWCRVSARAPTRCCWAGCSRTPDAHRYRIGANYNQLPVNAPRSPVHSYSKDGHDALSDRVRTRSMRRTPRVGRAPTPSATASRPAGTPTATWCAAHTPCDAEDDDWGQAGTLVRDVMDDAERDRSGRATSLATCSTASRAGPAARLRVLAQRRQGPG